MTAYTPNLPALITGLPGDPGLGPGASTRAPQTEFTRARQVLFLENLRSGWVRSAASAAGSRARPLRAGAKGRFGVDFVSTSSHFGDGRAALRGHAAQQRKKISPTRFLSPPHLPRALHHHTP